MKRGQRRSYIQLSNYPQCSKPEACRSSSRSQDSGIQSKSSNDAANLAADHRRQISTLSRKLKSTAEVAWQSPDFDINLILDGNLQHSLISASRFLRSPLYIFRRQSCSYQSTQNGKINKKSFNESDDEYENGNTQSSAASLSMFPHPHARIHTRRYLLTTGQGSLLIITKRYEIEELVLDRTMITGVNVV